MSISKILDNRYIKRILKLMAQMKITDEDLKLIKELQSKLAADGIRMPLGMVAGYAARKVLMR